MPTALAAVRAVMQEVTAVSKDDQFNGGQTRYAYRGVDRVVKAISASMRKHELVIIPEAMGLPEYQPVTTSNGKPASLVRVLVKYTVYGPDGSFIEVTVPGEAMDSSDKAVSKAMSVAWRTMLLQTFFLPTEEPDPDSEHTELGEPRSQSVLPGYIMSAAEQRVAKYDQLMADWEAAIEGAKGDRVALRKLYVDASAKRVPQEILDKIKEEGDKAS